MKKMVMIVMALTGLLAASVAQAEVAQSGKVYRAGSVVEMPNSKAMVSIPFHSIPFHSIPFRLVGRAGFKQAHTILIS